MKYSSLPDVLIIDGGLYESEEDSGGQYCEEDQSDQECTHHTDDHENDLVEYDAQSSILELQEALGPLLLARKQKCTCITKHPKRPYIPSHGCDDNTPFREPVKPACTGPFRLFSLPRELRDRIYFHHLSHPRDYLWTHWARPRYFKPKLRPATDVTNLLLTSRKVYTEAWQVFCRHNTIYLNQDPRDIAYKSLEDVLRHFPFKPSRNLRYVGIKHWTHTTWGNENGAADSFLQILRDAYDMKAHFPELRVFQVKFGADYYQHAQGLLMDPTWSEEHKVACMLECMRRMLEGSTVVPPDWIQWELFGQLTEAGAWGRKIEDWEWKGGKSVFNQAYGMLVNEHKRIGDLEDSGSRWIEETSREEKPRGRRSM
ncbi:hypothetical protein NX059_002858 [Plenodomus lindquistii]|nr:hypothetical protein NX059_002858 [Plenodomus lindquistii]